MDKSINTAVRVTVRNLTCLRIFSPRCRLSGETALIYLKVDGGNEAHVSGNAVARAKCDDIPRDEFVGEGGERLPISMIPR